MFWGKSRPKGWQTKVCLCYLHPEPQSTRNMPQPHVQMCPETCRLLATSIPETDKSKACLFLLLPGREILWLNCLCHGRRPHCDCQSIEPCIDSVICSAWSSPEGRQKEKKRTRQGLSTLFRSNLPGIGKAFFKEFLSWDFYWDQGHCHTRSPGKYGTGCD